MVDPQWVLRSSSRVLSLLPRWTSAHFCFPHLGVIPSRIVAQIPYPKTDRAHDPGRIPDGHTELGHLVLIWIYSLHGFGLYP